MNAPLSVHLFENEQCGDASTTEALKSPLPIVRLTDGCTEQYYCDCIRLSVYLCALWFNAAVIVVVLCSPMWCSMSITDL